MAAMWKVQLRAHRQHPAPAPPLNDSAPAHRDPRRPRWSTVTTPLALIPDAGEPIGTDTTYLTQEIRHGVLRYSSDPNRGADGVAIANAPNDLSALGCV